MAKKIVSFCMAFAMMAMCGLVSSCDKEEEIKVAAAYETKNAEGILVQESTLVLLNAAFKTAAKDAEGIEASLMANAIKSNFKANVIATVPESEIAKFRDSDMYFRFVVMKQSDPTVILSEARLYGSEF